MGLYVRKLSSATLGGTLRSLRKRQGISLEIIAGRTNIQKKYLQAFEEDAHHALPDPIYAQHLLKQFAEVIHADVDYVLSRYAEECGSCPVVHETLKAPRQRVGRQMLRQWRPIAGRIVIGLIAAALLFFIGSHVFNLISPPNLIVEYPAEDLQTAVPTIDISGQTEQEVRITINDKPVLTDPTGRFIHTTSLTRGLNIITVRAQRKYGRPHIVKRTVFLEDLRQKPIKP